MTAAAVLLFNLIEFGPLMAQRLNTNRKLIGLSVISSCQSHACHSRVYVCVCVCVCVCVKLLWVQE